MDSRSEISERYAVSWEGIDALNAHVAVLDTTGRVIDVNASWRRFGRQNDARSDYVGSNYLEVCRKAAGQGDRAAARMEEGLRALLSGQADRFRLAYNCAQRTFRLRARTISHPVGRVLIAHEDVTALLAARRDRNRADAEAAAAGREHAARIAGLHEELGQSLAAISLAVHVLERAGSDSPAVATIRVAVEEARRELRQLREADPASARRRVTE
ncbi:PAS domain-containing protein [Caulobacter sp.]|uniref:PAS domain-containing protein n=1 Tax=Caulobacter sp. TaxID=78 RepID=UPI003BAFBB62